MKELSYFLNCFSDSSGVNQFQKLGSCSNHSKLEKIDRRILNGKLDFKEATSDLQTDGVRGVVYKIIVAKGSFSQITWTKFTVCVQEQHTCATISLRFLPE